MKQWFTTTPHIFKIKLNGKNQVGSYNYIKKTKTIGSHKNVRTAQNWPMPWATQTFPQKLR
jgi:hypothetical protein